MIIEWWIDTHSNVENHILEGIFPTGDLRNIREPIPIGSGQTYPVTFTDVKLTRISMIREHLHTQYNDVSSKVHL